MGAYASLENNAVVRFGVGGSAVGTITGPVIDTAGHSEALVILSVGNIIATGTLAVKMQDCATTGGTYVDVPGAAFSGKIEADELKVYIARVKLDGNLVKQFIKFVSVVGVVAADHALSVVLSGNQYNPQDANAIAFTI